MNHSLGMAIETLVAILLMLTIGYCILLNKRLTRLKADEHSLKAVIGELITATEIAERAIGGLKLAVRDVNGISAASLPPPRRCPTSSTSSSARPITWCVASPRSRSRRAPSQIRTWRPRPRQAVSGEGSGSRRRSLLRAPKVQRPCCIKSGYEVLS